MGKRDSLGLIINILHMVYVYKITLKYAAGQVIKSLIWVSASAGHSVLWSPVMWHTDTFWQAITRANLMKLCNDEWKSVFTIRALSPQRHRNCFSAFVFWQPQSSHRGPYLNLVCREIKKKFYCSKFSIFESPIIRFQSRSLFAIVAVCQT